MFTAKLSFAQFFLLVDANVSPLGEGGDFETQINQVEQKLQ
jgi:hypothetical protein